MKTLKFNYRVGFSILIANFLLFVSIVICWRLGGFTNSEFLILLKQQVPIKAIYISLIIKFLSEEKHTNESNFKKLNSGYISLAIFIVASYILLLFVFVFLKAFSEIGFDMLINILIFIETFFGAYAGYLINDLFKKNNCHSCAI
jgi:hypothetical protein